MYIMNANEEYKLYFISSITEKNIYLNCNIVLNLTFKKKYRSYFKTDCQQKLICVTRQFKKNIHTCFKITEENKDNKTPRIHVG